MGIGIALRVLTILLIAGFVWVIKYRRQKQPVQFVLVYCALILISGIISWKAVDLLPVPAENVEVRALGEKNEAAKNDEIYLTKVSVNGKEIELKTATDDRWFWQGGTYVWRDDSDIRRPDDLSESFILKLPVGTERYIEFFTNIYKGIAEIEYQGNIIRVDCYSEVNGSICVNIEDTKESFLMIYMMALILTSGVIDLLILCIALSIWKNKKYFHHVLSTHVEETVLVTILIVFSIFSFKYSVLQSFWGDEIHQLGFSSPSNTISDIISYSTTLSDINPPLYACILYIIRRFIPFGQQWLLMINVILTISGILFAFFSVSKSNKRMALLFALTMVLNPSIHNYGVYELRPYSLLFMLSCSLLYLLAKRLELEEYSSKICILQAINYVLLCYSHIFGILIVFCTAVIDILEIVCKRLNFKYFKAYIICGFLFLPYVINVFLNFISGKTYYKLQNPGTQTADLRNIYFVIDFLDGSNLIYACLLLIGVVYIFSFKKQAEQKSNALKRVGYYSAMIIFLTIGISFVLSVILQTSYMKERYFICLIPYATFIVIQAAKAIYDNTIFLKKLSLGVLGILLTVAFGLKTNYMVQTEQLKLNQPFREAAEYLTSKSDFYSPDVAIMVCGRDPMRFGWQYYLSKDYEYQAREILSWSNSEDKDSLIEYKKVYIFYPYSISDGFKTFLKDLGFKQSDSNSLLRLITYEKNT